MAEAFDDEVLDLSAEDLKGKLFGNMTAKERLKICSYMIEATDAEQASLWFKHFEDLNWQQLPVEHVCIGHINGDEDKPLNLKLTWVRFQTLNACFYDSSISEYTHSETTDKWIDLHYDGPRCDVENFDNCIQTISALVEVRKPV